MHNRSVTAERSSGMSGSKIQRRYPIGAELIGDGRVHFRVWAPKAKRLEVSIEGKFHELQSEANGYFSGAAEAQAGTLYQFRLNGEGNLYPDPASRFQPEGPHGPSCVVDPAQFKWTDANWNGIKMPGQIIYEMHIGTFTPEGTFAAAVQKLDHLVDLGVEFVEVMPVNAFPGRWGWGYDGVDLYAVHTGAKQPWEVKPYATWTLSLPFGSSSIGGAAYDAAHGLIYISQQYANGADPVNHAFKVS